MKKSRMHAKDGHAARRRFLGAGLFGAALAATPLKAAANLAIRQHERALDFHNLHTDEKVKVVYWAAGHYVIESLDAINRILRDHRTGDVANMDLRLIDLLGRLHGEIGEGARFEVISGYRSPTSNAMLAKRSGGVAKHSLHMEAKAIDIRVPGMALADLRRVAMRLQGGGVGYYPKPDFLHVDVGRVRYW